MKRTQTKSSLSPARKSLLELMQKINFGRIEGLLIDDGEPVLNSSFRIVRKIRFGAENCPRREFKANDFVLKTQVVDFFIQLEHLKNGTVNGLEIKDGLPCLMNVEETVTI